MKTILRILAISSLFIGVISISCVSGKKFVASENKVIMLQNDSTIILNKLNECYVQIKILKEENASLKNENAIFQSDLIALYTGTKMTIDRQALHLRSLLNTIQTQEDITLVSLKKIDYKY